MIGHIKKSITLAPICLALILTTCQTYQNPALAKSKETKTSSSSNVEVVSLTKQAKVNMAEAESIALKEVPGRVKRIELETDDGVLIYEIIICQAKVKKEVRVEASTGKILEIDKKLGKCD